MLRLSPHVSVERSAIETGGAKLAQRQHPRAFAPNDLPCKSHEIRLWLGTIHAIVTETA
jgi:hypothetical protein